MLIHPQFNPIAIPLGEHFGIHWYGLMYLVGFVAFMLLGKYRARRNPLSGWQPRDVDDLLFYGVMGVVLGGRLGYVLFYNLSHYLQHPLEILYVWRGGMSFHGGFLGVLIAMTLFARRTGRRWLDVTDFIAPQVPLGLMAGRLANFINGELWGRVTSPDAPWAMLFPQAQHADARLAAGDPALYALFSQYGGLPRHPSQLYQMFMEGVVLFAVLWLFSRRPRPVGAVSGVFLIGYGAQRILCEFAREPDDFLGLLSLGLSMGQWLSLPMVVAGIGLLWWSMRRRGA